MAHRIDYARGPRRRDVLAFGAGLALLPAASWARRDHHLSLATGYCCPTPAGVEGTGMAVVAADRLASGESALAAGIRVTIEGLVGDTERLPALGVRSAELRVGFPAIPGAPPIAPEGRQRSNVDFRAWSYQLLPIGQFASPNSFIVPVDHGLALALEVEAFGTQRFETILRIGREPSAPKLRAGRYLIAPDAAEFCRHRFNPAGPEPLIAFSVEALS